ncbi:Gfo/Idh/MocA family protein [Streptomyces luteolus]|uniref:Gfo/Idh/MocA family oxidoreductase n=1 Tax=Streptomyces luteolus TaxID=3043615 RepID=A0ABT6T7T2_9ACTN|nr:Gfo/Idh/MocA family oxidoreductase [Streptomyces sp. B-S-A12]MDI3422922.1 Gfo/Idh/MocA family oxidoreductase [Streptomyces sp. B-S-A12]
MTDVVRVGVLGCAEIARRRMLPALDRCPDTRVTAVASRDPARAAATAEPYGARVLPGYAALLAAPDVDAVYVPLPLALHAEWTEAALRAGKHVLAEKPLTADADRTAELCALARARGLALMENVMFVHHGQHTRVRQLVADGALGELRSFRAEFTVPRRPEGDIRLSPELGGGALWDTGVYPLRAAQHLLGPDLAVVGAVAAATSGSAVDTAGSALLRRTTDGVAAHVSWGLDHAYRSGYELTGSAGRLTLDMAFTPPAGHRPVVHLHDASGSREYVLEAEDQVANTVAEFAAAVRRGTAPQADTLAQARLLADVRRAATI